MLILGYYIAPFGTFFTAQNSIVSNVLRRFSLAATIRLSRIGAKKKPVYRIVVVENSKKRDGRYIDLVGLYNPIPATPEIRIDAEKALTWLKNGATLSDTVKSIFRKQGILEKWIAVQNGQPIPEAVELEQVSAISDAEEPAESSVVVSEEEGKPGTPEPETEVLGEEDSDKAPPKEG